MRRQAGFGLRPRGIGELLDLTFRVYRRRFGLFAVVGVFTALANLVITLAWQAWMFRHIDLESADPGQLLHAVAVPMLLLFPCTTVVHSLGALPVVAAVRDSIQGTDRAGRAVVLDALRRIVPGIATAFTAAVLVVAGILVSALPVILLSAALAQALPAAVVVVVVIFGILIAVLPGMLISLALSLALPVVYLERQGPFRAIGRSWTLVLRRGRREFGAENNLIRVFVIALVSIVVLFALSMLSSLPQSVAQAVATFRGHPPVNTAVGPLPYPLFLMLPVYFLGSVLQGIFVPIGVIPWPLVYFDIRTRHEGLDLEIALERMASEPPEPGGP